LHDSGYRWRTLVPWIEISCGMISGSVLLRCYQVSPQMLGELRPTTVYSSRLCYGYCGPGHLGGTCPIGSGPGTACTSASAGGLEGRSGTESSMNSQRMRISRSFTWMVRSSALTSTPVVRQKKRTPGAGALAWWAHNEDPCSGRGSWQPCRLGSDRRPHPRLHGGSIADR
jgi:hypothetical protein